MSFFSSLAVREILRWLVYNFHEQFSYAISGDPKVIQAFFKKIILTICVYWFIASLCSVFKANSNILLLIALGFLTTQSFKLKDHLHNVLIRVIPEEAILKVESFDKKVLPFLAAFFIVAFLLTYALFQKLILALSFIAPFRSMSAKIIQQQASEGRKNRKPPAKIPEDTLKEHLSIANKKSSPSTEKSVDDIQSTIDRWLSKESDEASLSVLSYPGFGFSETLESALTKYQSLKIHQVDIDKRVTTGQGFLSKMSEVLGHPPEKVHDFLRNNSDPQIIFIRNTEKLFINKKNGFKAYQMLIDSYSKSQNIFSVSYTHLTLPTTPYV